jgi:hypothetical protein
MTVAQGLGRDVAFRIDAENRACGPAVEIVIYCFILVSETTEKIS